MVLPNAAIVCTSLVFLDCTALTLIIQTTAVSVNTTLVHMTAVTRVTTKIDAVVEGGMTIVVTVETVEEGETMIGDIVTGEDCT